MKNLPHFQFDGPSAQIPKEALRFKVPLQSFAKSEGQTPKPQPVKLLARSGQPIEHWYYGVVVHDLAGMRLDKEKLPIDYCHDCDEVLGYLDKFDINTGDLVCTGMVIPFTADDRAAEVIFKSGEGIPYEASISFGGDGILMQYVSPGEVTQVNGYAFEGPGVVVREWPLRGVAICPYGADSNTTTEFSGDESSSIEIKLFQENAMDKKNAADAADKKEEKKDGKTDLAAGDKKADASSVTPGTVTPAAGTVTETKFDAPAFITAFGDKGARWFVEGKSFAASSAEFITGLRAEHETAVTVLKASHAKEIEALNTKVTELTGRLDAAKLGNPAVEFQNGEKIDAAKSPTKFDGLSDNLRKVASAIKMPGKKGE